MNSIFQCGGKKFSNKEKILVIAELGTAHAGSLDKAKTLISAAVDAGADAVKFQIVYADEILHPNTGLVSLPTGEIPLYKNFKRLEVDKSFFESCAEYCKKKNVLFSASPFGFKSADELCKIKPAFVKIASPELNYIQLLEKIARENFPMILSSGVSLLSDIEKAIYACQSFLKKDLALLHCITSYPAPEEEYNISILENLKNIFGITVGVSDHSKNPFLVPALSVACGATIVEKHFCLSNDDGGLDDTIALDAKTFSQMVKFIRECTGLSKEECKEKLLSLDFSKMQIEKVLGDGKKVLAKSEKENYGRSNRSLHYTKDFSAGHRLTDDDVKILRTEKILSVGEAPIMLKYFMGSVLQKNVTSGDGAKLSDIIKREQQ